MANIKTTVTFISFQIQETQTIATIQYKIEPEEGAVWGGGKRMKSFPPEKSVVDIMLEEIPSYNFMQWERAE
ncbi:MAG: hypothetical protein KAU20_02445 [Nanoarchaeota archaeon]|nr:hypothetical protein [Nanoarchaeota archaeon]